MTEPRRVPALTCDEVNDLAAGFVLGALEEEEMARVRHHLSTCTDPHAELDELGGVVPYLVETLEPVEPPAALGRRIVAAVAAEAEAAEAAEAAGASAGQMGPAAVQPPPAATPSLARRAHRTSWFRSPMNARAGGRPRPGSRPSRPCW